MFSTLSFLYNSFSSLSNILSLNLSFLFSLYFIPVLSPDLSPFFPLFPSNNLSLILPFNSQSIFCIIFPLSPSSHSIWYHSLCILLLLPVFSHYVSFSFTLLSLTCNISFLFSLLSLINFLLILPVFSHNASFSFPLFSLVMFPSYSLCFHSLCFLPFLSDFTHYISFSFSPVFTHYVSFSFSLLSLIIFPSHSPCFHPLCFLLFLSAFTHYQFENIFRKLLRWTTNIW